MTTPSDQTEALRRVQVYDGDGECVLDVAVLGREDANALTLFVGEHVEMDVYNDEMPRMDRRGLAVTPAPSVEADAHRENGDGHCIQWYDGHGVGYQAAIEAAIRGAAPLDVEAIYRTFADTLIPTGTLGRSRTRRGAIGVAEARIHLRRVIDEYAALRESPENGEEET